MCGSRTKCIGLVLRGGLHRKDLVIGEPAAGRVGLGARTPYLDLA
jgi:hypothetical protein